MHKKWRRLSIFSGTAALMLAAQPLAHGQVICPANLPATSLDVAVGPEPLKDECDHLQGENPIRFFDAYSWQTFIALNWPAAPGRRGVPDTTKTINDRTSPRVWETWKSVEETFLPNGAVPSDWSAPETLSVCKNANELGSDPVIPIKLLGDLNQGDDNGGGIGPLIAQNSTYVRYEIRMNKVEFDDITGRRLYLRDNLPTDPTSPALAFPPGTIDVKAAWRELKDGENADRYYQRDGLAVDPVTGRCDKRHFVLIGFHIGQKTPMRPQWIWSTFEHIDNLTVAAGAPVGTKPSLNDPTKPQILGDAPAVISKANPPQVNPTPVQAVLESNENRIPTQTAATNAKWETDPQIQNSVWRFYQLVMSQWPTNPAVGGAGVPFPRRRVANMTMETYRQPDSCIGCHVKTTSKTDFVWFLSNRAFPVKDNLLSNAKVLKDHVGNQ
jgi:hypothetical protein